MPITAETITVTIRRSNVVEFIHDDRLAGLMKTGEASIKRASHVEPGDPDKGQNPLRWYADMAPIKGPVLAGPDGTGFNTRAEALAAEVQWIKINYL